MERLVADRDLVRVGRALTSIAVLGIASEDVPYRSSVEVAEHCDTDHSLL